MLKLLDYVTRVNTAGPTGIVEALNGNMTATVNWGTSDKRIHKEELPQDQLQVVEHKITSPKDVMRAYAKEHNLRYQETDD